MSEAIQLEQFLSEIAGVQAEAKELDQEQKMLKQKAKMLAEKIIQEMKKKNSEKKENINRLLSKVGELEAQLNKISTSSVIVNSDLSADGNIVDGGLVSETFSEPNEETVEDSVTITEVDEEETAFAKPEKKRRKLF